MVRWGGAVVYVTDSHPGNVLLVTGPGEHVEGVQTWNPDAESKVSQLVSWSRVDAESGPAVDAWQGPRGPGPRPPSRKRIQRRSLAAPAHTSRVDTCPLHAG